MLHNKLWKNTGISSVRFEGLTGPTQFAESKRNNFKLDLMKLKAHATFKVGECTPKDKLDVTDKNVFQHGCPPNITLRVMTRIEQPFVIARKQQNKSEVLKGNGLDKEDKSLWK